MIKQNIFFQDTKEIIRNIRSDLFKLNKKKILLIGYNGFLGRYFVNFFNEIIKNKLCLLSVDCFDNYISSDKNFFSDFRISKNINFFKSDITIARIKKKYDYIIFLAGIASPWIYKKFPLQTLSVSYDGVLNMLKKSKIDKSEFIFFSSSEIYGNPDIKNIPTKETYYGNVNSFGPRSCYDEGKRVGETLCYIYHHYYKVNIKIIRPFNVFGPEMDNKDYRIIPNIIDKLVNKKKINIHGEGNQTRTFCYISDAISGFLKVIIKGRNGEIYNIGNKYNEISMLSLVKLFKKILKINIKYKKVGYPKGYPADEPIRRCPDISKSKKHLNFNPSVDLKSGIIRVLKAKLIIK